MSDAHIIRQKLALLILDILAFLFAFVAAMQLRFGSVGATLAELEIIKPGVPPWEPMLSALPVMVGVWLMTLVACGAYRIERNRMFMELGHIVQALMVMIGIVMSITFFYRGSVSLVHSR